ncbi:heat shock protein beta-9 [Emydura macquarii macquarii]|uniref:heat shock protein beta-9 n=1 Tax=Emydura macquarii macquarii TaxID=1129001 RepID=UPI00352B391E
MLGRLHLLPPPHSRRAPLLAPGALLAELEQELLQEMEAAWEFASSIGRRLAGRGNGSPAGEPGQSCSAAPSAVTAEPFAVRQDVQGFAPEELAVTLTGRKVLLTGRKETQREDGRGSCSYKHQVFRREWDVPEAVDADRLTCSVSREGQLCIEAPCLAPTPAPERNVPIQISPVGSPAAPAEPVSEARANGRAKG